MTQQIKRYDETFRRYVVKEIEEDKVLSLRNALGSTAGPPRKKKRGRISRSCRARAKKPVLVTDLTFKTFDPETFTPPCLSRDLLVRRVSFTTRSWTVSRLHPPTSLLWAVSYPRALSTRIGYPSDYACPHSEE
jgi:hypothetical protein